MSQTLIRNTRMHDISLCAVTESGQTVSETIPMARENRAEKGGDEIIYGEAMVDDELLEAAKKSIAALSYFSEGWLIEGGGPKVGRSKSKKAA